MAAIDPSAIPEHTGTTNGEGPLRATLKLVYEPKAPAAAEDESEEDEFLRALLGAPSGEGEGEEDEDEDEDEDEESSDDEDEKNGGPSDPSRTKKARKEAAAMQMLMKALQDGVDESNEEMGDTSLPKVNGVSPKSDKGKGKAVADLDESSDEDGDEDEEVKELVLCTLDLSQVSLSRSRYCTSTVLTI